MRQSPRRQNTLPAIQLGFCPSGDHRRDVGESQSRYPTKPGKDGGPLDMGRNTHDWFWQVLSANDAET
jgi:hypothetical protein